MRCSKRKSSADVLDTPKNREAGIQLDPVQRCLPTTYGGLPVLTVPPVNYYPALQNLVVQSVAVVSAIAAAHDREPCAAGESGQTGVGSRCPSTLAHSGIILMAPVARCYRCLTSWAPDRASFILA